jgi:hypothetical protein
MKFQSIIVAAALLASADASPRRLRKGELRRVQEVDPVPKGDEYIEVGADAEEVVVKAKTMKSMSMDGGRTVDAKAGELNVFPLGLVL